MKKPIAHLCLILIMLLTNGIYCLRVNDYCLKEKIFDEAKLLQWVQLPDLDAMYLNIQMRQGKSFRFLLTKEYPFGEGYENSDFYPKTEKAIGDKLPFIEVQNERARIPRIKPLDLLNECLFYSYDQYCIEYYNLKALSQQNQDNKYLSYSTLIKNLKKSIKSNGFILSVFFAGPCRLYKLLGGEGNIIDCECKPFKPLPELGIEISPSPFIKEIINPKEEKTYAIHSIIEYQLHFNPSLPIVENDPNSPIELQSFKFFEYPYDTPPERNY